MHTLKLPFRRARRPVLRLSILAALAVAIAACGSDPFAMKASYGTEPFTFSLYALSGTGPANAPAALDLQTHAAVKVDGTFGFDLAFDLDRTGKIVLIPQRLVGTPLAGARIVSMQRISGTYESVLEAPQRNWVLDSTFTVAVGEVVGVKLTSSSCVYQLSQDMYAKLVVDSVKTGGLIFGRGVIDPNCGFRSFETGIPTK